jgi:translation initiation factor 6
MHVIKASFRGNPNIGLYMYTTDTYCLVGPDIPEEEYERIAATLEVPVHRFTIAGTGLLGVFLVGTSSMLLVPSIISDRERAVLEKLSIPYTVITTDLTALGNNVLCNDHGCLVSDEYTPADQTAIGKALGLAVKPFHLGEVTVVGSCAYATNTGCLLHRGALPFEEEMVADTLQVPVTLGTVNLGNPYIKSGVVANAFGFLVGELSGGPEIMNAEEAFNHE